MQTRSVTSDDLLVISANDDAASEPGDLIFKTSGVERGRIKADGTTSGVIGAGGGAVASVTAADGTVTVAGTVANPTVKVANLGITDAQVAAANKDGAAGTASMRTLGAGAAQAASGTDARLSDSRAPNGSAGGDLTGSTYPNPTIAAGAVTDTKVAAANKDGAAGTASMRTLGAGAAQAAAGNDARLSDARTPTGAAGGDLTGSTFPNPFLGAFSILPRLGRYNAATYGYGQEVNGTNALHDPAAGIAVHNAGDVINSAALTNANLTNALATGGVAIYKIFAVIGGASGGNDPANSLASDTSNGWLDYQLAANIGVTMMTHQGAAAIDGSGRHAPDLSDVLYQQACIAAAAGFKRRYPGVKTLFIDTVNDNSASALLGYTPDGYEDDADFMCRGMLAFVRAVFPALRALGYELWINGSGSTLGPFQYESNAQQATYIRWMRLMAHYVDGFVREYYMQNNSPTSQRTDDSIAVNGVGVNGPNSWWRANMRSQRQAYALGKGFIGWVYSTNSSQQAGVDANMRYSHGSFLIGWDGKSPGGVIYGFATSNADTAPTFKWNHGYPTIGPNGSSDGYMAIGSTTATGVNALNSATINCGNTLNFNTAGSAMLNGVAFTYTGKTATSFTGCGAHAATTGGETINTFFGGTFLWARVFQNGVLRLNTDPTNSSDITVNGVTRTVLVSDARFDAT